MTLRNTRQQVEILAAGDGAARVTRQQVELLVAIPIPSVCEDFLALSDIAAKNLVVSRVAMDTLSLSEKVARIYETDTFDLVALNDQALAERILPFYDILALTDMATVTVIRAIVDTITLNEEVTQNAIRFRGVEDALALQEEAVYSAAYRRKVYESLVLTDESHRIVLASDILSLSEEVSADRIISVDDALVLSDEAIVFTVYPRVVSDTLAFVETVIPGHVTQRDVTDTLSLTETSVGDACKVVDDALSLTDEATFVFVRLIQDALTLTDEASYVGAFRRRVWETIALTEGVHHNKELDASAIDTLSLTDETILTFEASDTLSLSDAAVGVSVRVSYDTLALVEEAVATRDRRISSDELVLSDVAVRTLVKIARAADTVILSERAWPGFHRVVATDILQSSYTEYDPETYEETVIYVGLQDLAITSIVYGEPKEVEDHLSFAERAECIKINADAIAVEASDSLSFTENVRVNALGVSVDSLMLSDTAEMAASKLLADDLVLSDEATFSVNRNSLTASDTIQLSEATLWHNQLEDYLYVYHPFVGEASGSLPDPPDEELEGPIPGITDPFKLVYPVTGPFSDTLVLRAPNLGNRDRLQMNRISRETRGGTLIVYADPIWPKIQTLVLNFSGLTWTEASGLYTFMDSHLGLEIGALDWEHRFWSGVITNLANPIVQDGRDCQYSVGFEFEGELATYSP